MKERGTQLSLSLCIRLKSARNQVVSYKHSQSGRKKQREFRGYPLRKEGSIFFGPREESVIVIIKINLRNTFFLSRARTNLNYDAATVLKVKKKHTHTLLNGHSRKINVGAPLRKSDTPCKVAT